MRPGSSMIVDAQKELPIPTKPADFEPEAGRGSGPTGDQPPLEPPNADPVVPAQGRMIALIARHPALFKLLGWLGWNTPGGSANP
jgi:hypothetical protein